MKTNTTTIAVIFIGWVMLAPVRLCAQQINPDWLKKTWNAQWITGPNLQNKQDATFDPTLKEYGVFKFRKTINLKSKPTSFVIHVSADNRYKLFVNGKQISQGPARGDLYFWNFETLDIAPYLKTETNTIAAVVWNDGVEKPIAQVSHLTAFILQGNTKEEEILNTNDSWKTIKDESYQPLSVQVHGYYATGPGEFVSMNKHVKEWYKPTYSDNHWAKARTVGAGIPKDAAVNSIGWMLVPSPIPAMEMSKQRLSSVRKAEGIQIPSGFPATEERITIPPNTKAMLLLDQGFLTNTYPTLLFSGGQNASLSMAYAEGLYLRKNDGEKGNRNDVNGKIFVGKTDSLISDGTANQEYTPLWWRTYRYIKLAVNTKAEPLVIEDLYGTFTGYPFTQNAKIQTANPEIDKMMEIGWRTLRLCTFETYMDCPYYEQLQYVGDTRIQALVSFYNSGDDRLARNALTLIDHSRLAEGITLSRYPSNLNQEIPTFSLWWIAMLHDYYMYRQDSLFIKDKLPGARQVFSFFEKYQQADGSLKNVPYWLFTDWVGSKGWNFGMSPKGVDGESAILDMQLLWTYQLASKLENNLGIKGLAQRYNSKADQLKKTIQKKYWDAGKGLFADTKAKDFFSQHTNSLAILSGVISGSDAVAVAKKMLLDTSLAPASIYFKYYLHQALIQVGLGNDYLTWLDKWRENIAMGLTTWAESSDVSTARSDCHAWGSSLNIEFFRTILGIDSGAPGFTKIKIAPHLGGMEEISGEMPHPNGKISVHYKVQKNILQADIYLPKNTDGVFIWKGKKQLLKAGNNTLNMNYKL